MTSVADAIAAFHSIQPTRFPILSKFEIRQLAASDRSFRLQLVLELASRAPEIDILKVSFDRVVDLKIDWPQWSLVQVDLIEVADISSRGLENIRVRVSESSGFFAFSCWDFQSSVGTL